MTEIRMQAEQAIKELLAVAKLRSGDLLVIGCSSSEIVGQRIGNGSSMVAAEAVWEGIVRILSEQGIRLAAQCCEHLNRAAMGSCRGFVCHSGLGAYGRSGGGRAHPCPCRNGYR